jgi:diguanylate cyclase (GGDEF)-like protein
MPNVRAALMHLETATARLNMTGPGRTTSSLAILLVDGDDLKSYNSVGGYAAGDRMLCDLSATLQRQLRPNDFLARWRFGDEFLLLLRRCELPVAMAVAERLRKAVLEESQSWQRPISVSIGVALGPQHGRDPATLISAAERALLQAKESGKNCVVVAQ